MEADVRVWGTGTVIMLTPLSEAAREWCAEHVVIEPWMRMGASFACEHRMVDNLLQGMHAAGLKIEGGN